jgi:hypothetical protein
MTNDPTSIEHLTALAQQAHDAPSPEVRERLARAALVHGLAYCDRIDLACLWLVARVDSLSTDTIRELLHVLDREHRRRQRAG